MASDLDEPLKFSRKYKAFNFAGEAGKPVELEGNASDAVEAGLSSMMSGVDALIRAKREGRIEFALGVTATMLETMGVLLMRAAHTSDTKREDLFQHWSKHGPPMVNSLIAEVETRPGRMLMPEDLASMFMGKPPGY
ncbi:MAG TPA: hypothetical protein VL495_05095 [Edaphobacter sp.]|nr:hypothetical protein [Edaphobacter sp.]